MNKLWENPSPTSTFTAQTIALSSSDYDFLMFEYTISTTDQRHMSTIVKKGESARMHTVAPSSDYSVVLLSRDANYISSVSYSVSTASATIGSVYQANDIFLLPIAIYGIKSSVTVDVSGVISDVSTSADKCMLSDGTTSVEDAIRPTKAYVGVCAGAAYNVITFGCMFPYSVNTATIKVISCLGMPDVEYVDIPCTVAKDAVTGTVAIFATISDTTLMQNIRNYGTVACLEFTYL